MGLPRILKNMAIFADGNSFAGESEAMTLPKLTRKTEAWRGGGLGGAVHVDLGLDDDALKAEWTIGGYPTQILRQFGAIGVDGVLLRFAGAFQRDDSEQIDAVEIVLRGRHQEIDRGEMKVGERNSTKIITHCVYYKEVLNGATLAEIDVPNMIHIIDGVDLLAEQRRAIGR
ncbi:phage major tail tube protein [Alcanivorax sp. S71-1-4]|uniref:phage major tail tube protein n=1 Tax=Alcanivorax sp. S71-1-4 TaxID=1177159 RepID=UPI00135C5F19|nr:phage major tail tube protein [Alcanivorax sp. S71-1-4]KAF0810430.1 phage major tail tube protein [Alcanivorax sp. S71-1-4]